MEGMPMWWLYYVLIAAGLCLVAWVCFDISQKRHAILHNFPIVGHFRYWLEAIGPELRQYIVTNNNEERPFSRDQRRWVYASSKKENNYFGFGTDLDLELSPNFLIIKHSAFPVPDPIQGDGRYDPKYQIPCAKVMGEHRQRTKAFRPQSVVNISAMSFGSLGSRAVEALNRGAALCGCLHNTGEGGVAPHHQHGGDLIMQVGTGYFGCRDKQGNFDASRFRDIVQSAPIKAIELKLSQGAKPGRGGLLPASKITKEIAEVRGIPMGKDCMSPATHSEFNDADGLLDFVERLSELSNGIPVGIKSAVGDMGFWTELARLMEATERGVDYIAIDGGEGGTGAAPLVFADHVALPFKLAFSRVYREFVQHNMHEKVLFAGAGKLGFPETALLALGLGCDMIMVGREAMLAIGCIQAQKCHSGHCPTGIATQNWWLQQGLDPTLKGVRLANYVVSLRKELLQLSWACGHLHPALVTTEQFEIIDEKFGSLTATECFGYEPSWGLPAGKDRDEIRQIMEQIGTKSS
ncbi:MAG: glutamate synthase domain-containing protein 2 [Pirellulaceae bacterium]|jgi:glutamate synthase domain-containing protein 2